MDKFALIGWPAAGSLSPLLFGAAYGGKYGYGFIEQQDWATAWRIFTEGDYRAVNITAPHKMEAARAAAWRSPEVEAIGAANILVKTDDGIKAYNSDYLAVKQLIRIHAPEARTAVVVGFGGAGKAAFRAALDCGLSTTVKRHSELTDGVCADLVIFTLPKAAPGMENILCNTLIEANYRDPQCEGLVGVGHYVGGREWLRAQAVLGYEIMTGEAPDRDAIGQVKI